MNPSRRSHHRTGDPAKDFIAPMFRREDVVFIAATLGLGLIGIVLLLDLSLPSIVWGAALVAGAVWAFLKPEIGLYALVLNALIGLTHLADVPRFGPVSVPVAFEGALLLSLIWSALAKGRRLFVAAPQHLLLLALGGWMIVSILANGGLGPASAEAMRNLFLVRMLVFFLLTNVVTGGDALKRLAVVVVGANVGLLVVSRLATEGALGAERLSYSEKLLRTTGVVHNPNTLAFDLTTLLVFCVAGFLYVRKGFLRMLLASLVLLDVAAILSTLSRSGFVSLAAVIVFLFFRLTRNVKAAAFIVAISLIAVLIIPWELSFRFSKVEEFSEINRLKYAQVGLAMALDNPVFGVGFGNYLDRFAEYNRTDLQKPVAAHNLYMDIASQMGFPALVLYLAIVVTLWRRLRAMQEWHRNRKLENSFLNLFSVAVEASLLNLVVFGLSGHVEFEYSVFIVLGFGMLLFREHQKRLAQRAERRGGGPPAPGGAAGPEGASHPAHPAGAPRATGAPASPKPGPD